MKDDGVIYFMPEEVDHHSVKNIAAELDGLIDSGIARKIVFDVTDTRFMGSSGIGVIIGRAKKLKDCNDSSVAVRNTADKVNMILKGAGIYRIVTKQ